MNENESFWYHNYQVVQAQLVEYYERNQKAIEIIETLKNDNSSYYDETIINNTIRDLLDILKGSDKE